MKRLLTKLYDRITDPVYCPRCGSCGEEGCCGIERFLNAHVKGKTTCLYEERMIEEIISAFDEVNRDEYGYRSLIKTDKQTLTDNS